LQKASTVWFVASARWLRPARSSRASHFRLKGGSHGTSLGRESRFSLPAPAFAWRGAALGADSVRARFGDELFIDAPLELLSVLGVEGTEGTEGTERAQHGDAETRGYTEGSG
jgi:hypothetical protein